MAEGRSERVIFLHGDLHLTIKEARNLPNMDIVTEHLRRCFTGCDSCYRLSQKPPSPSGADTDTESGGDKDHRDGHDKEIHHRRRIITSDPYVTFCVPQATLARTRVIFGPGFYSFLPHNWSSRLAEKLVTRSFRAFDYD